MEYFTQTVEGIANQYQNRERDPQAHRKLQNRGLDFGILVAARGITGNAQERTSAHQIIAQSLSNRRRIVILTRNDIITMRDTALLVTLIKTRLCELAVTGTLFP